MNVIDFLAFNALVGNTPLSAIPLTEGTVVYPDLNSRYENAINTGRNYYKNRGISPDKSLFYGIAEGNRQYAAEFAKKHPNDPVIRQINELVNGR